MSYHTIFHNRHRTNINSPNIMHFKIRNRERVDNLLSMIIKAYTTSTLHQLEYHRTKLTRPAFRILLLLLTTELNSAAWKKSVYNQEIRSAKRRRLNPNKRWLMPSKGNIEHCCRIIFYYIVSVINKYKMSSPENLWTQILENSLTKNKEFYEYLYKHKINLPNETCKIFSKKLSLFYSSQSQEVKIKLIELGFTFNDMITRQTPIKDLEKILFLLKQPEKFNSKIFKLEEFILFMNTPEKLSLFLSHFPDYDINQVNKKTMVNVLEQLFIMKPYFYLPLRNTVTPVHHLSNCFTFETLSPLQISRLDSHPNEIVKYRAARIINLLQQLIFRGARLSKPVYSSITIAAISTHSFFITSIGIYVLIDLYMNDLYPDESSSERDHNFVSFVIKYIKRFEPEFQELILHRLSLTYSIVHKSKFIIQQRENEDEKTQQMNDKLFEKSLKLKEWCRLKIKDNCSQNNIKKLNLPKSLVNYCSFGFFEPNYALQCIREVVKHKGNIKPKRVLYSNETGAQIVSESSDDETINNNINNDYESDY